MEWIYDKPQSAGTAAVLKRAWRLSELDWKPTGTLAINERHYVERVLGGGTYTGEGFHGTPYASARVADKFIGIDVHIRTFLSALDNPLSALYNRDLGDFSDAAYHCKIKNAYLFYGTVCSAFVNYSLNLPMHRSTHEWGTAPEFYALSEQCADALQLCDTLVTVKPDGITGGHVRLVTALGRDETGHVQAVEISEGIPPLTVRRTYTEAQFEDTLLGHTGNYRIYRYRYLDDVQDAEVSMTLDETPLMIQYGQDANYRAGEAVTFALPSEISDGMMTLERNGAIMRIYPVCGWETVTTAGRAFRVLTLDNLPAGSYCARLSGYRNPVHFTVVLPYAVRLRTQDGTPLVRRPYTFCAADGSALTENHPSLYGESGELLHEVTLGIRGECGVVPIMAAAEKLNGKLTFRTAALFHDADGKRISLFSTDDLPVLYALTVPENTILCAEFADGENCEPLYLSWKDEAYVSYSQRLLTAAEKAHGTLLTRLEKHWSDLTHFMLFCRNENGRISTEPEVIVIR